MSTEEHTQVAVVAGNHKEFTRFMEETIGPQGKTALWKTEFNFNGIRYFYLMSAWQLKGLEKVGIVYYGTSHIRPDIKEIKEEYEARR